ncbi:MAG: S53 family peptidase [Ferrimicrobium acidiphilum]
MKVWMVVKGYLGVFLASVLVASGMLAVQQRTLLASMRQPVAPATMTVEFDVVLKPRNEASLLANAWARSQQPPGHYLTPAQFGRDYAPSPVIQDMVSDYFHEYGMKTGAVWPGGLVMPVTGTVAQATAALGVAFDRARLSGGRSVAVADTYPAKLSSSIDGHIAGITGLFANGYFPVASRKAKGVPRIRSAAGASTISCSGLRRDNSPRLGYAPAVVARYYHLPRSITRHSVTVGIAEFADVTSAASTALGASLLRYARCVGEPLHLATVAVDGGSGNAGRSHLEEAALDIETLLSYAPGVHLLVYTASSGNANALYLRMVSQDKASILLTTWGTCEANTPPQQLSIEQLAFAQAALQGQTVVAASGDDGSSDCLATGHNAGLAVDNPASQPMVTGVGGEEFTSALDAKTTPSVWNDVTYSGASGGGLSQVFSEPSYQRGVYSEVGRAALHCRLQSGCRLVPDVAMIAVGAKIDVPGRGWTLLGGTSLAASVFAAGLADLESHANVRLGLVNPWLYSLDARTGVFTSVQRGGNDFRRLHPGQFRVTGRYSLATGLGSPNFALLMDALKRRIQPQVPQPYAWVRSRMTFHLRELLERF